MKRIKKHIGLLFTLAFLIIHLVVINDYGFTWDFHFHFFGGGKLLGIEPNQLEPRNLPYDEPDPRRAWTLPYGPIMSIPPVISYLWLHKAWELLPADQAYHLPIILWGIAGIGILYMFLKEAYSSRIAIFGLLFIALTPRYFADIHNNMKDIPSAVIFALNMWLLWRLVRYKRPIDLITAIVAFAVAFNVKINSIFIPIVFAVWVAFMTLVQAEGNKIFADRFPSFKAKWLFEKDTRRSTLQSDKHASSGSRKFLLPGATKILLSYLLLAPLAAFLLWWVFWPDAIGQLAHAWRTFAIGTNNIEVLLNGSWYCSGSTVPWYYPYWYLGITTPLPILIFFIVGLLIAFREIFNKNLKKTFILLLLWLFLPLTRYLIPSVGVIDGIRHFEEVLFPIAAIAALGLDSVLSWFSNNVTIQQCNNSWRKWVVWLLTIGIFSWLTWNIVLYHPYQITYFNELVGGAKGAFGNYDLDYWGTSQKAAVSWVNQYAPQNATVYIVMAGAVAGQYLRPDLLTNLNSRGFDEADYVILLNRQSFLYRFTNAFAYLLEHKPVHTIEVAGAPLVWIFDNRTENKIQRLTPWWQDEDPCIYQYWKAKR